MSIPILLILILLFSSADLVFQKYILNLIHVDNELEIMVRFILILLITLIFIGVYTYIFQKRDLRITSTIKENSEKRSVGFLESYVILGSVNALFFIFILFQFTYLFGGENNLSVTGITYSEYARHGFFELIVMAIISLLLLLSIEKYLIKQKKEHEFKFKILATVLFVQVMIIMISTFTRLSLYEKAYGFTVLILYSHALNILLAVIFCLCLIIIYKNQEENIFCL